MFKKSICFLLLFSLILTLFAFTVVYGSTVSYNVNLYEGGRIEASGNISSGSGKQLTFLVRTTDATQIVYIDQIVSTTNGTFLFRFTLPSTWKGATLDFTVGGEDVTTPMKKTLTIPDFPININSIENNSVRVGFDVYQMFSPYYISDNVVTSIVSGGNTIYYKIGDVWYDILDERATSAAFLIPQNAVNPEIVTAWLLNMWYPRAGFGALKFDPVLLY